MRSFPRLHRKLICLLCTARFARALRRAHSCACSLAHSFALELMGKRFMRRFHTISTHCASVHRSVRNAFSQTRARLIFCRVTVFLGVYRTVCPFVHRSIRRSVRRCVFSFSAASIAWPVSRGQYHVASIGSCYSVTPYRLRMLCLIHPWTISSKLEVPITNVC